MNSSLKHRAEELQRLYGFASDTWIALQAPALVADLVAEVERLEARIRELEILNSARDKKLLKQVRDLATRTRKIQ